MKQELSGHLDSLDALGIVGADEDSEAVVQSIRWWSLSKIPETRRGIALQMFNEFEFMLVHRIPGNI